MCFTGCDVYSGEITSLNVREGLVCSAASVSYVKNQDVALYPG